MTSPARQRIRRKDAAPTRHLGYGRPFETGLALLVAVPPVLCLLLTGLPLPVSEWAAWLVPLGAAVAVLACRRHVVFALVVLTAGVLVGVAAGGDNYGQSSSLWTRLALLTPLIAVGLVYWALGAALPLWRSLSWLIGSTVLGAWLLAGDVPYLMTALGWWLVGRVFRSRQEVADLLRSRVAELTAERERFVLEAVRLERTKIARELHDVVAHCMTVIVIQARAGQQLLEGDPSAAADAADVIRTVASEAESDIGALVELMDPERSVPLTRLLLDELVARAGATGTVVTAEIGGNPDGLDPKIAATAHRMVQEAITNSLRHAPGAAIRIELRCTAPVTLEISNEPFQVTDLFSCFDRNSRVGSSASRTGRSTAGSAPAAVLRPLRLSGSGRGLLGIRERVGALGGTVTWGDTQSGGWRVIARFPGSGPARETAACPPRHRPGRPASDTRR